MVKFKDASRIIQITDAPDYRTETMQRHLVKTSLKAGALCAGLGAVV